MGVTLAYEGAPSPTVLVVDDEVRMQRLLEQVFRSHGFNVLVASDGDLVVRLVKTRRPDAVVLDLKMPRVPGLEALRALRTAAEDLPVIVLTGVFDEECILETFEAGADDYVTKPFQPRVLVARVRAAVRRHHNISLENRAADDESVAEVALDPRTHHAHVRGEAVPLSPTEYQLLRTLMRGAGRVFTTADLLAQVWGPAYVGQDDIVRANIYRLRQKLEPVPSRPRYVQGRRGVGYYFMTRRNP
jgi:two-component system KDP operon response regulator KdpE